MSNKMEDVATSAGLGLSLSHTVQGVLCLASWLLHFPPPHQMQGDSGIVSFTTCSSAFWGILLIGKAMLAQSSLHSQQAGLFLFVRSDVIIPA